jgi:RNA polymerase sigma-19 factor, ECF subfamily
VKELYVQYRVALKRFVAAHESREDPEDVLQEIFLDLVRRPPPEHLQNALAYLFGVARRTLVDMYRRRRREPQRVSIEDVPNPGPLWLEDDAPGLFVQESMNRALRELPRAVQVAILRQHRDGWTYTKIAEELGCTTHAVKKYISRGIRHFRDHFAGAAADRDDV